MGSMRRRIARPVGGFAAARFADEAERLAAIDVEADVVDGLDVVDRAQEDAAADREIDLADSSRRAAAACLRRRFACRGRDGLLPSGWPIPASSDLRMQQAAAALRFEMLRARRRPFSFR